MNISMSTYRKLEHAWRLLRFTYGLLFLVVGVDKFFNFVVHWDKYVSPFLMQLLPPDRASFLMIVGVVEIVIGLLIFSRAIRLGAYGALIFLSLVVLNLLSMGIYLDIAARDVVMAVGVLTLIQLTSIKQEILGDN